MPVNLYDAAAAGKIIGFIVAFGLIAQIQAERDCWTVAALGLIPLAVGLGYFVDWKLIHRDARA